VFWVKASKAINMAMKETRRPIPGNAEGPLVVKGQEGQKASDIAMAHPVPYGNTTLQVARSPSQPKLIANKAVLLNGGGCI